MKLHSPGSPPWALLPAHIAAEVRPALPAVAAAVIEQIAVEVPSYARPLEGSFGKGVRRGVEVALSRFLDLPGTTQPALAASEREVYAALGRGELQQGRTLEALLAAYRVGARVAFRRFAGLAREAGLDADDLVPLAEATFAYIDELSAASIEGYAEEQSQRAGERDRLRADLLALLVSGTADDAALNEAAAAAAWPLPPSVAPVVVPSGHDEGLAATLGPATLVAPYAETVVALVPTPSSARGWAALRRSLRGRQCAIGLPTACRDVAAGLRLAGLALLLPAAGPAGPIVVEERLVDLLLHRDPPLVEALAARALAPLSSVPAARRERLAETLLAWLAYRGERQRVAEALHVHPQTVAYRMTQLREHFGDALLDPDQRFALELALRAGRTQHAVDQKKTLRRASSSL